MRVLIVDDDALYRGLIVEALRYEGYEISEANSVASALRLLGADSNFGVILCDLQMDGLNGLELLKTVRLQYTHIPVVVTSGHSADDGIGEIAQREATYYLVKPFSIMKLLKVIQKAIQVRA